MLIKCMLSLSTYAMHFLGTPYVWAGNTVEQGFDCSGFVCEMARSCGMLGHDDLTAQGLYTHFSNMAYGSGIKRDAILFFGKSQSEITHVAIAINDNQMIEAGGEGRENTDKGSVRVRPIDWRNDMVAALQVSPEYVPRR